MSTTGASATQYFRDEILIAHNMIHRASRVFFHTRRIARLHGTCSTNPSALTMNIIWVTKDGEEIVTPARTGDSLLKVAHEHDIPLEGACEGSIACSTCHVILESSIFNSLNPASDEEEDMLDLAFAVTSTSRLGCQVIVDNTMNNIRIQLPKATRNFAVDGHIPKPH